LIGGYDVDALLEMERVEQEAVGVDGGDVDCDEGCGSLGVAVTW
jgi:hypothetical protein